MKQLLIEYNLVSPRLLIFDLDSTLLRYLASPIKCAREFLILVHHVGFHICYLTARWKVLHAITEKTLGNILLPNDKTIFLIEKENPFSFTTDFKIGKLRILDQDYLICGLFEDNDEIIEKAGSDFPFPIFHVGKGESFSEWEKEKDKSPYEIADYCNLRFLLHVIKEYSNSR